MGKGTEKEIASNLAEDAPVAVPMEDLHNLVPTPKQFRQFGEVAERMRLTTAQMALLLIAELDRRGNDPVKFLAAAIDLHNDLKSIECFRPETRKRLIN